MDPQLATTKSATLETRRTSQSVIPSLPPCFHLQGRNPAQNNHFLLKGRKSGCYSPKVILITGSGKSCAYNEVFWSQKLSFLVILPQHLVYNRSETAVPFNFVFKLHSVGAGAATVSWQGCLFYPSGEVLRKRTVYCPPPHSLPPTHLCLGEHSAPSWP